MKTNLEFYIINDKVKVLGPCGEDGGTFIDFETFLLTKKANRIDNYFWDKNKFVLLPRDYNIIMSRILLHAGSTTKA